MKEKSESSIVPHTPDEVAAAIDKMGFLFSGTDKDTTTDPATMRALMHDCGIPESLNHPALHALRNEEIPFGPLREKIIEGIVNNPPLASALVKAAEKGVKYGQDKRLLEAIHYTVLMEVITTLMVNNTKFAEDFQEGIMRERGGENPGNCKELFDTVKQQTGDSFTAVKMISVEPGIWRMRCWREHNGNPTKEQVDAFIERHGLTGTNKLNLEDQYDLEHGKKETHSGLQINILEAIFTEMYVDPSSSEGNRHTGADLIRYLNSLRPDETDTRMQPGHALPVTLESEQPASASPSYLDPKLFWDHLYRERAEGNQVSTIRGMGEEWTKLYSSWNARFVMTKFYPVSALVLPKLFIPSVISASPEQYMATRIYSLWLTLNFMNTMIRKRGMQQELASPDRPENYDEFIKIWGEANEEYAKTSLLPARGLKSEDSVSFWNRIFKPYEYESFTIKPPEAAYGKILADGFVTLALAANDGIRISQEDPSFLHKYSRRSAFVLLLGVALIIAGSATLGTTAVAGIALLAVGGFFSLGGGAVVAPAVYQATKKTAYVDTSKVENPVTAEPIDGDTSEVENPAMDTPTRGVSRTSVVEPDAYAEEDESEVDTPTTPSEGESEGLLPADWDDDKTFAPVAPVVHHHHHHHHTKKYKAEFQKIRGSESEDLDDIPQSTPNRSS